MNTGLDLDDVCAGNPLAERQLAELRDELATPEPWRAIFGTMEAIQIWADFERIALVNTCGGDGPANARRIVACVNACAGIETETLEAEGSIAEIIKAKRAEIAKLRAEREELRKAITGLLDAANRNVGGMVPGGIAYWCHSALGLLAEKV